MRAATMVIRFTSLACTVSACARPAAATPPPLSARDAPSMTIEYEIARKGPDEGVVLRGRTNVHWPEDPGVEHEAHGRVSLHFAAAIERNDGTVDLQMKYREAAPDGTNIRWEPLLHLARGTTATSEVGGAGWSREVRVKVL